MIKLDPSSNLYKVSYSKRHPVTGKPRTLRRYGIKSQSEAKRTFNDLVVQLNERFRESQVPTWGKVLDDYYVEALNRGLQLKTVENYRYCLEAHTRDVWGERLVDTIVPGEIRELVEKKVGNRSSTHQQHFLKFIRAVFTYAVDQGHILKTPVPQLKFKANQKKLAVLTEQQAAEFLRCAKEQDSVWYPLWCMALYTGMRSGELYALTWDKVDVATRTAVIDSSWNSKDGFKSTKSGYARTIEIAQPLVHLLGCLKSQSNGSPYVLPRLNKWTKGEQARECRAFLIANGLPSVKFHDLRATWATMLLGKGVPPAKVMKMGGWENIKTMMIYVRAAGLDIKGSTDCLNFHLTNANESAVIDFIEPLRKKSEG